MLWPKSANRLIGYINKEQCTGEKGDLISVCGTEEIIAGKLCAVGSGSYSLKKMLEQWEKMHKGTTNMIWKMP